jgi:dTDP-4-dehydrorhamnose 3,5-epimerase
MNAIPLKIPDIILFEPRVFGDDRGFFFESFNQNNFKNITGITTTFVQDNHSKSTKGVIRGLHYQLPPKEQGKLIRAIQGEIFDVVVDIRKDSPTYGQWLGEVLSAGNKKQLWIPPGFAHGFLTLSDTAEIIYKTTDFYAPEFERCNISNDTEIGIEWPSHNAPFLSRKDQTGVTLNDVERYV